MRTRLALRPSRRSALRCAYCREAFRRERSCACRACGTLLHDECRRVLGACPSLGCEAQVIPPRRRSDRLRFILFWPLFLVFLASFFLAGLAASIAAFLALAGLLSAAIGPLLINLLAFVISACAMAKLGELIRGLFEWV